MDREQNLQLKKEIAIEIIKIWNEALTNINKDLKRERVKKLLKRIKECMYEEK